MCLQGIGARATFVSVGWGSDVDWVVMADLDGNEFDVLGPLADTEPTDAELADADAG